MNLRYALLPLLLLLCSTLIASEVKTYDLQHRSADEMIPLLRPMLDADGAISGRGYTLIIRSSQDNLLQLEEVIQRIDQASRMLRISVARTDSGERQSQGASLSSDDKSAKLHIYSNRRRNEHNGDQQLQVMEGYWATIRSGQAVPQVVQRYRQSGGNASMEQRIEYRDIDTGFEVRPRVRGDQVTLDIRPFSARPSAHGGGVIEQQQIVTTVRGGLGEWIELGGVDEDASQQGQGTIYSTRKRDTLTRNVRIKVELVGP